MKKIASKKVKFGDHKRMEKVINFIDQHLSDSLSLEQLSEVAFFSKYHFHRQFSAFTGVSLFKYLQLLRLKRASYQLVFHETKPITVIALDAHFSNAESFSRAFKKAFSQTPSDFRLNPLWQPWHQKYQYNIHRGNEVMDVKIVDFAATKIAVFEHKGAVDTLNYSIEKFINWRKRTLLSPIGSSATFGLVYHDPQTITAEDYRFDVCGEVKQRIPENSEGVINKLIPAGRCALVTHKGPHHQLEHKIRYLYEQWLGESGESLRDFPCYFKYVNFFPEVAECDLVTQIYLPIR